MRAVREGVAVGYVPMSAVPNGAYAANSVPVGGTRGFGGVAPENRPANRPQDGASVIATVRSSSDEGTVARAGTGSSTAMAGSASIKNGGTFRTAVTASGTSASAHAQIVR